MEVEDHSFYSMGPDAECVIPYGVHDLAANIGWVNVGVDHDTAAFAVASIRRWWQARGRLDYPHATRLLITADAGGSNNHRFRLWQAELAALAAQTGLAITVCRFPPGTSKWNKIKHRLFSRITLNWRGRPLTSHKIVVNTIASTRTSGGLRVEAELDSRPCPLGVAVTAARLRALPIDAHPFHGEWSYTIHPPEQPLDCAPADPTMDRERTRARAMAPLADARLTGMTPQRLAEATERLPLAQAAQTEQRRYRQRGAGRQRRPGAGARALLSDADRVLITIVYLRQICSQKVLAELLEINTASIGSTIADTRLLLEQHNVAIAPTTLRLTATTQLQQWAVTSSLPGQHPDQISARLSDPALTGISRQQLTALIDQIAVDQQAQVEQRRYHHRGGPRQLGSRGGVFRQKLTNADRVLATILYDRKVATRQVLAELLTVSPRTIGSALLDVRPVLRQHGYTSEPTARRYVTAAALLASLTTCDTTKPPG